MEISVRIEFNKDQKQFDMTPLREIRLNGTQEFAVHSFFKAAGAHDAYEKLSTFRQTRFMATVITCLGLLLLIFAIVSGTISQRQSVRNAMNGGNSTATGSQWYLLPAAEEDGGAGEAAIQAEEPLWVAQESADALEEESSDSLVTSFLWSHGMPAYQYQQPPPNSPPPNNQTLNSTQPPPNNTYPNNSTYSGNSTNGTNGTNATNGTNSTNRTNATSNSSSNGSYYSNSTNGSYYNPTTGSFYNATDGSFYNATDGSYYNATTGAYFNATTGAYWDPYDSYGSNSASRNDVRLYYNMSLATAIFGALFIVAVFVFCLREGGRRTAYIQLQRFEGAEMEFLKSTMGGQFDIRPDHRRRNCFGCNCCYAYDFGFLVSSLIHGPPVQMPVAMPPAVVVRTDDGGLYQPDPAGQTPMLAGQFAPVDDNGLYWKDA